MELGDSPGILAGGLRTAPRAGRVSRVYVLSIVVFSVRLRIGRADTSQHLQIPPRPGA